MKAAQSLANRSVTSVLGSVGRGAAGSVTNNFLSQLNAAPIGPGVSATWAISAFVSKTGNVSLAGGATLSKNGGTLAAGDVVTFTLLRDGVAIGPDQRVTATTAGSDVVATASIDWVDTGALGSHVYAIKATIAGGHTGGFLADEASVVAIDV